MKLADLTLQKLAAPANGQKFYADDSIPGFGVRVSQGDSKSFLVIVGKERQHITLGRYPIVSLAQARERARTILAERQLGIVRKRTPVFAAVHAEYLAQRDDRVRRWAVRMLDHPEKTARLLAELKAAAPFTVALTPEVIAQLRAENVTVLQIERTVSDLSYAGGEGGIVCHLTPVGDAGALFISLTHVRVPRSMPLALAIQSYQKHRVKKLKKQGNT